MAVLGFPFSAKHGYRPCSQSTVEYHLVKTWVFFGGGRLLTLNNISGIFLP